MTTDDLAADAAVRLSPRRASRMAGLGLVAALLAACGGSVGAPTALPAASPSPTVAATASPSAPPTTAAPTAEPTATPTVAASPAPTATQEVSQEVSAALDPSANGGFAFAASDVLAYYQTAGFTCGKPTASTQAAGYQVTRCSLADKALGTTTLVAMVTDPSGITGDAFAGYVDTAGRKMPPVGDAVKPLAAFLGAALGEASGTEAGTWLVQHLGEASAQTKVGDMAVAAYTTNDSSSVGQWVEVANSAFMAAPTP